MDTREYLIFESSGFHLLQQDIVLRLPSPAIPLHEVFKTLIKTDNGRVLHPFIRIIYHFFLGHPAVVIHDRDRDVGINYLRNALIAEGAQQVRAGLGVVFAGADAVCFCDVMQQRGRLYLVEIKLLAVFIQFICQRQRHCAYNGAVLTYMGKHLVVLHELEAGSAVGDSVAAVLLSFHLEQEG